MTNSPEPQGPDGVHTGVHTPASLDDQRVEAPTLGEQLTQYEQKQALLETQLEELDPMAAQGVYLLVAVVVGVSLAAVVASGLATLVWML